MSCTRSSILCTPTSSMTQSMLGRCQKADEPLSMLVLLSFYLPFYIMPFPSLSYSAAIFSVFIHCYPCKAFPQCGFWCWLVYYFSLGGTCLLVLFSFNHMLHMIIVAHTSKFKL